MTVAAAPDTGLEEIARYATLLQSDGDLFDQVELALGKETERPGERIDLPCRLLQVVMIDAAEVLEGGVTAQIGEIGH